MQARCYSPEMKRFISADPTGLGGGVNFYTYADGNPLNSIDPEGLCARPSLFGRTAFNSSFGVHTAVFGGVSPFGAALGIAPSVWENLSVGEKVSRYVSDSIGARGIDIFIEGRDPFDPFASFSPKLSMPQRWAATWPTTTACVAV